MTHTKPGALLQGAVISECGRKMFIVAKSVPGGDEEARHAARTWPPQLVPKPDRGVRDDLGSARLSFGAESLRLSRRRASATRVLNRNPIGG